MMGTERRSMVMNEQEKLNTAYHEAGPCHCRIPRARARPGVQGYDHPARTRALGVTMYLPEEDRYSLSKQAHRKPDFQSVRRSYR